MLLLYSTAMCKIRYDSKNNKLRFVECAICPITALYTLLVIFSEYGDVRTANQFANRVYGAFTAIEQ